MQLDTLANQFLTILKDLKNNKTIHGDIWLQNLVIY